MKFIMLPISFLLLSYAAMVPLEAAASYYVTALEDQTTNSFLVASSDHDYAIYLGNQQNYMDWATVSLRQDKILVTTTDKTTESLVFSTLNETIRDFVEDLFAKFSQDLAFPALLAHSSENSAIKYVPVLNAFPYKHGQVVGPNLLAIQQQQFSKGPATNSHYTLAPYTTNYFNLQKSMLNETLLGDAYNFDLKGNILEVYSTTVSLSQLQNGRSLLYRDQNYFSYSRPNMPLGINRFFLVNEYVFFIYHDGSVSVKSNWQLDYAELDLITDAKLEIKELQLRWPHQSVEPEITDDPSALVVKQR